MGTLRYRAMKDSRTARGTASTGSRAVTETVAELDHEYVLLCCLENAGGRAVSVRTLAQALVAAGHRPVCARHLVVTSRMLASAGPGICRRRLAVELYPGTASDLTSGGA